MLVIVGDNWFTTRSRESAGTLAQRDAFDRERARHGGDERAQDLFILVPTRHATPSGARQTLFGFAEQGAHDAFRIGFGGGATSQTQQSRPSTPLGSPD